eukprot:c27028_g2_i1 orf=324-614(+)
MLTWLIALLLRPVQLHFSCCSRWRMMVFSFLLTRDSWGLLVACSGYAAGTPFVIFLHCTVDVDGLPFIFEISVGRGSLVELPLLYVLFLCSLWALQ